VGSRFLRLCKAVQKTSFGISTGIEYGGDGMAQRLSLELFHHFIFTVIFKTTRSVKSSIWQIVLMG